MMTCHWPGLYTHGTKLGFEHFRRVIAALEEHFREQTLWMTSSELARYAAARQLTRIEARGNRLALHAPLACPRFTLRINRATGGPPKLAHDGKVTALQEVRRRTDLAPGAWFPQPGGTLACFDLAKGRSTLNW
jgi:hypothetical protein